MCADNHIYFMNHDNSRREKLSVETGDGAYATLLFTIEIVFIDPTCADNLEHLPFMERVDGRAVTYTTENYIEAFELFYMLQPYGGSVK